MNHVEIEGGVVNDVEFGFTPNGRAYGRFTLAVPAVVYDPQIREDKVVTHFISCMAWGYTAEQLMADEPRSGEKVYVRGSLDQSAWEDKDGKKQSKTRVRVIAYQFTNRLQKVTAGV